MNARRVRLVPLGLASLLTACGSGRKVAESGGGDFVLLRVTPPDHASLYLNDAIQFDFSTPVDLSTADFNAISFDVFDLTGRPLGERPRGTFRLAATPGDAEPGRRLEFIPPLPHDDLFLTGGLRPARRYVVQLVGGDRRNDVVLRGISGRELTSPMSFSFTTVDGATAAELFRNPKQGGPRRTGFSVTPSTASATGQRVVAPNFNAADPIEVRLAFDQAVNPHSANVPAVMDLDPRLRDISRRGRVFLEYDDPAHGGADTWIPAAVELERNDQDGAVVVLRPIGVLPTHAVVDVRVLNTFEDIAGESNVANAAYTSLFGQFVVEGRHAPQFDVFLERFDHLAAVDLSAPFLEPLAELTEDGLRASLAFEGADTANDYEPLTTDTILNTDFTRVQLRSGTSINVAGGVFHFRNVRIPANHTVLGQGSNPMVWLVTGDMTIEGTLACDGADGEAVTSTSAELPAAGGPGHGGGGRGGRGSVTTTARTARGETGFGAAQAPAGGGTGGQHSCQASAANTCRAGSGGGGGSFASKGDPDFYTLFQRFRHAGPGEFDMRGGDGRVGCVDKRNGPGIGPGDAGPVGFGDADANNDFAGAGIRFTGGAPSSRVSGELAAPRGGTGGGGGGDASTVCESATNWRTDAKGGGGGGGGGALIIKCLGRVRIGSNGRIRADGGHGGGGYPNGTSAAGSTGAAGGGGGGGSGGMVVVMCTQLDIVRHGETYGEATRTTRAAGAYDFAITADGGVGKRNAAPGLMAIRGKYPTSFQSDEDPERTTATPSPTWQTDNPDRPAGGFGGHGVVQLMTPSLGDRDGTGAFFDDSIAFYASDADMVANPPIPLPPATKKVLLGWRGHRTESGGRVDDRNQEITLAPDGFNIGDVKPAPVLLPCPFGPLSRVISEPIDLGRVDRLESAVAQGVRTIVPRGTASGDPFTNLVAGPTFVFGGTEWPAASTFQGYLRYDARGAQLSPTVAGSRSDVAAITAGGTLDGRTVHRVDLAGSNALLAQIHGRYTGYLAQLLAQEGRVIAELRVLGHDGVTIFLDPRSGRLPDAGVVAVQLAGKFAVVETSGESGLGPAPAGVPLANVRIGFAFYRDATDPATRVPATGFEYGLDLDNPDLVRRLRDGHHRFVQYDILFNTLFQPGYVRTDANGMPYYPGNVDTSRGLRPSVPRPTLRELALPFQF